MIFFSGRASSESEAFLLPSLAASGTSACGEMVKLEVMSLALVQDLSPDIHKISTVTD
jgi:hypothetical protein